MSDNCILYPSLQKFYSALKCLNEIGPELDFFDNISNIDTFFSEFRNITFVLQKQLKTIEQKSIYCSLNEKHFSAESMKWFITKRNETTKEQPFRLEKQMRIKVFLPTKTIILFDERLTVEKDIPISSLVETVEKIFIDNFKMIDVHFCAEIVFRENGDEINIYEKIKSGLAIMKRFLEDAKIEFNCDNEASTRVLSSINKIYQQVFFKDEFFTMDYQYSDGKFDWCPHGRMLFDTTFSDRERNLPIKGSLFEAKDGGVIETFYNFILMHIPICQMQKEIMPTFMLLYKDHTFSILPFMATSRTTFYRYIDDISINISSEEIVSVFFIGEAYCYEKGDNKLFEKPYSERIKNSTNEAIWFKMISSDFKEMSVYIDKRILSCEYAIVSEIKTAAVKKFSEKKHELDCFIPIKKAFLADYEKRCKED